MKQIYFLLAIACGALFFTACDPKLDFDHIDPSLKVSMGLALPIGEISATVGDFLNDTTIKGIEIDENGVYQYVDTFTTQKEFHAMDMANYISSTSAKLHIGEYVFTPTIPAGIKTTLRFPLGVRLQNVNTDMSNERLDKLVIEAASFTSIFYADNFPLAVEDIKKLTLELPSEHFERAAGNRVEIPLAGHGYGEAMPITVDNFTLNLMKDKTAAPSNTNVVDSVTFYLEFEIESSSDVAVSSASNFTYNFEVNFLDYQVAYGYFKEGNKMHEQDTISVIDYFPAWSNLKKLNVPLSDPSITIMVTHSIGAPLYAQIDTFAVYDEEKNEWRVSRFASNNNSDHYEKAMTQMIAMDAPLDATVTEKIGPFDKNDGELDKLFEIRPDQVFYTFSLTTWDKPGVNQHRLVKNTRVDVAAALKVPFKVNAGMEIAYHDTIDMTIDQYSIDSLLAEIEMVDSVNIEDVHVVLTTKSTLPFDVEGTFTFTDEYYTDLGINVTTDSKTVRIPGIKEKTPTGVITPGEITFTVKADNAMLEKLAKTKHLVLDAYLKDMTDKEKVTYPVAITTDTKLQVKLAVAASVDAYVSAAFNNNNK